MYKAFENWRMVSPEERQMDLVPKLLLWEFLFIIGELLFKEDVLP